jgi:hypothetical protein
VTEVGLKPDDRVRYLLGQTPRMELGYAAGPMSQHLGGDCAGLRQVLDIKRWGPISECR